MQHSYDSISAVGPYLVEAGFSQQEIAWMFSAYYLPNIVFAFFVGIVLDKFGEEKTTIVLSVLTVTGQAIISFFPSLIPMILGRMLLGLAAEGMLICQCRFISVMFPQNLGTVQSIFCVFNRSCSWLAYIVLPGVAEEKGWKETLYVCFGLCIFSLVANALFIGMKKISLHFPQLMGEDLQVEDGSENDILLACTKNKEQLDAPRESVFKGMFLCLRSFPMWCILLIAFFYYGAVLSYGALSTVFVQDYYSLTPQESSFIISMMFVAAILVAPVSGYISDAYGMRHLLMSICLLFSMVPFAIISITNKISILSLTIFCGISYGMFPTILYAMVPMVVEKKHLGIANGLLEAANAWGVFIFPAIFGVIYQYHPPTVGIAMFSSLTGICLIINFLLCIYSRFKLDGIFSKGKKSCPLGI